MDVAYRTLCDSPAPTNSVLCNLPFSKDPCFATANETKLQIFTVIDKKLVLVWEKNFWAKIVSIFAHHEIEYDSLILICDIAKVVVLKVVGDVDLQETEFHQFDSEEFEPTCARYPTKAVIDPKDSCIALLIGISTIYFLTLSQPEGFDINKRPMVQNGQHSKWETINGAISFDLVQDCKPSIYRVRDIKFLEGYNRPTLAMLHEPIPTWSVRLPLQKSTIVISIISPLLIEREGVFIKEQSISWSSRPLPHNAITIIPVLVPHGGFLVLCKNSIIYMTHTSGLAYGLNALARIDDECPFELCGQTEKAYEIFSPVYAIIDPSHVLITVDDHHPAILTLHTNGIDVTGLSLFVNEEEEFHPSLLMKYSDDIFFSGSVIEDSFLFQLSFETTEYESTSIESIQLTESQLQLYESLYDSSPINPPQNHVVSLSIYIMSKIYQLGTVTCATPFINISEVAYIQGQEDSISMALGCGYKKSGCLQFLRLSLTPQIHKEWNLPDMIASFASNKFDFILFSTQASTSFYQFYPDFKDDTEAKRNIISATEPTIAGGDLIGAFMQITQTGARLFNEDRVLSTWITPVGKEIRQAVIKDKYSAVIVDQSVYVLNGDDIEVSDDATTTLPFNMISISSSYNQSNKVPSIYKIAIFGGYIFMLQTNNSLFIYSLETNEVVLFLDQFRYFHDVFYKYAENSSSSTQTSIVLDMNIIDIGNMPVLTLIMKEGNIILYQIFHDVDTMEFAFRRIRTRKLSYSQHSYKYNSIIQFKDINGMTGAFICGPKPMFLIGEMGYPRLIRAPENIFYFTQYKNDFFYGDNKTVKLANFENLFSTETHIIDSCIVQRKMIYRTPRCMTYAPPWNSLVFFASHPIPFSHENEPNIDKEASLTPHYQRPPTPPRELPEDNYPISYEEQYSLYVATMNNVIKEEIVLDRHEVGNCVTFLHLSENYLNAKSSLSEYLAIGTGYMCHEERMVRGRMAIYKGTNVQITDQQDKNEIKLQELYNSSSKDLIFHAPIVSMTEVDGYIAAFVGSQLQMITFIHEQDIKVVSFLNVHFFASQLLSMKNYMFYVDAYKGFQMIRWRKYGNKLITVAKDFQTFCPLSASLMTHNETFGGALYDSSGNVQLFEIDEYAIPADAFIIRSVFHIGCRALSAGMFPIRASDDSNANEISGYFGWFVGDKGKIGVFSPIKNDTERRKFCIIQNSYEKMMTGFSHLEYRYGKFQFLKNSELISQSPRLVIDMDLILDLLESNPEAQKNCTKLFSRSISEILASVAEIYSISSIFE